VRASVSAHATFKRGMKPIRGVSRCKRLTFLGPDVPAGIAKEFSMLRPFPRSCCTMSGGPLYKLGSLSVLPFQNCAGRELAPVHPLRVVLHHLS